jgi:hypothetical protein
VSGPAQESVDPCLARERDLACSYDPKEREKV